MYLQRLISFTCVGNTTTPLSQLQDRKKLEVQRGQVFDGNENSIENLL